MILPNALLLMLAVADGTGTRSTPAAPAAVVNTGLVLDVEAYGAQPDNKTVNTQAFRAAFADAASAIGNGSAAAATVRAAGPGVYVTGCFNLTSWITFEVATAATVFGVQDDSTEQYTVIAPLPSYGTSRDNGAATRHQALIMTVPGAHHVAITGGGTIDGGGSFWWHKKKVEDERRRHSDRTNNAASSSISNSSGSTYIGRPRLIEPYNASDVEISHLTVMNPGFWTIHPVYCTDVYIHDVVISSPANSPNTDGIDPDSSQNVLIERCTISCGDDHIAIKSGLDAAGRAVGIPSKNITVRNNVHYSGRGISVGSEVSGGVEDVLIESVLHLGPSEHGLHIKTASSRGGYIRNIRYSNITLGDIVGDKVISLTTSYGGSSNDGGTISNSSSSVRPGISPFTTPLTDISVVQFVNISRGGPTIESKGAGSFSCFSEAPCKTISLQSVTLDPAVGWECKNVKGGTADNVSPPMAGCFS